MSKQRRLLFALAALAALSGTVGNPVLAEDILGPWTSDQGNGPFDFDENQMSVNGQLTVGDNTTNSAAGEMFASSFTQITLGDGDKIVFTGSVTLTGIGNVDDGTGFPRTQFRFGLFNGNDVSNTGWVGYLMQNASGTGTPNGALVRKNVGNTNIYLSTTAGASNLQATSGTFAPFVDDTYSIKLSLERTGANLQVTGEISGALGFIQSQTVNDANAGTSGTYSFNRVGFLLGNNLGANQAVYTNLQVALNPVNENADFDGDGDVDGADFLTWQRHVSINDGSADLENGDADDDGNVTGDDLDIWKGQFGAISTANVNPVPEPGALALCGLASAFVAGLARRRRR